MNNIEVLEIVEKINNKLNNGPDYVLTYESDGYSCLIKFLGINFWNSEEDIREIIGDDYEPLEKYLIRELTDFINGLQVMKDILNDY